MVKIELIPESIQLLKMDDSVYFSDTYRDYISNSKLGLLNPAEGGSYEKFEKGFNSKYSDSYELGSAIHAIVLQNDLYFVSEIKKPNAKLGVFIDKVFDYRNKGLTVRDSLDKASIDADYYSGKITSKRIETIVKESFSYYIQRLKAKEIVEEKTPIYLSKGLHEKYNKCTMEVLNNPYAVNTLFPDGNVEIFNEYAILCEIKVTYNGNEHIIKLKGKIDNFHINHDLQEIVLNDLKSSGKPVGYFMGNKVKGEDGDEYFIEGSYQKYHYFRQMALYGWLIQCALTQLKGLNYSFKSNMVVVETIPNFKSKVYPVKKKHIELGLKEFRDLIKLLVEWKEKK